MMNVARQILDVEFRYTGLLNLNRDDSETEQPTEAFLARFRQYVLSLKNNGTESLTDIQLDLNFPYPVKSYRVD